MSSLLDRPIRKENWLKEARDSNGDAAAPARLHGVNGKQKAVPDAGPWEPVVQKMVAFQHLGDDWDGQGAPAPSYEVLASAIGLAYTLHQQGVDPPNCVVPGVVGSVPAPFLSRTLGQASRHNQQPNALDDPPQNSAESQTSVVGVRCFFDYFQKRLHLCPTGGERVSGLLASLG